MLLNKEQAISLARTLEKTYSWSMSAVIVQDGALLDWARIEPDDDGVLKAISMRNYSAVPLEEFSSDTRFNVFLDYTPTYSERRPHESPKGWFTKLDQYAQRLQDDRAVLEKWLREVGGVGD